MSETNPVGRVMKAVAPSWYAQVVPPAADAPAETPRPPQERLKREFCQLLHELSRARPVVLFLDDVHWADLSTADLLAHLGRQCRADRVLAVLTYRPTELLLGPHPFLRVKLELQAQGACRELPLGQLETPVEQRHGRVR